MRHMLSTPPLSRMNVDCRCIRECVSKSRVYVQCMLSAVGVIDLYIADRGMGQNMVTAVK